ncbi:MAG: anti-sigma factor [Bdellovibrionales bacterium]
MPKRELSCFLCRELLYEFVTGTIDSRRRQAVQEHLETCPECKKEQDTFNQGLTYLKELGQAKIHPNYLKEISEPEPFPKRILKKIGWHKWPDPVRWTVESVVVGSVLAVLIGVVSQKFLFNSENNEAALYTDTENPVEVAQQVPETPSDQLQGNENGENPYTGSDEEYSPEVETTPAAKVETSLPPASTPSAPVAKSEAVAKAPTVTEPKSDGFLYRGSMYIQEVGAATPSVVKKIISLGGKRAGEVELGWKQPGGSYFHFSMPEKELNALLEHLKQYGKLNLVKEKNRRVMPSGTIRIILNLNGPRGDATVPMTNPEPSNPSEPSESAVPVPTPASDVPVPPAVPVEEATPEANVEEAQ